MTIRGRHDNDSATILASPPGASLCPRRRLYPLQMGLSDSSWLAPNAQMDQPTHTTPSDVVLRHKFMSELIATRTEESTQLAEWLQCHMLPGAFPMHEIIANASLPFNHLWQDLGLSSRQELLELMTDCFPQLVEMNINNMFWKKFFCRQRCLQADGELICRSPSCDDCSERQLCIEVR